MVNENAFRTFGPDERPLDTIVKLSRYYGSDPDFVLAGGGNTSVKNDEKVFVKGSGCSLASIDSEDFVEMDRRALSDFLESKMPDNADEREEVFKVATLAARIHPEKAQRPSVECVLHNMMPGRYVVHTHPTMVNMITCTRNGEKITRELFGDKALWVPYVDPGFLLAETLNDRLKGYKDRTGKDCPDGILMQNHGLIVCGNSPEEVHERTERIMSGIRCRLESMEGNDIFGTVDSIPESSAAGLISTISTALEKALSENGTERTISFDGSLDMMRLVGGVNGRRVALGGPLTPDQIVYCKSFPLWFVPVPGESEVETIERVRKAIGEYRRESGFLPIVILVEKLGMFNIGTGSQTAETANSVYLDAIKVMAGAEWLGGIRYLSKREYEFIEHWEVEAYRRQVSEG